MRSTRMYVCNTSAYLAHPLAPRTPDPVLLPQTPQARRWRVAIVYTEHFQRLRWRSRQDRYLKVLLLAAAPGGGGGAEDASMAIADGASGAGAADGVQEPPGRPAAAAGAA